MNLRTATPLSRGASPRGGLRRQDGFILPLTLWVIAAMGVVIAGVGEWVAQTTENARIQQERLDNALALANIQNELVFALGTRPLTFRGLEVGRLTEKIDRSDPTAMMAADYRTDRYVRMDGRPYTMESAPDYEIRIYDGRGLININAVGSVYLRRMFGLFNIPEPTRNSLMDALEDYTDRDDLTRVSGAEQQEYARLGRRPPANAWLVTPLEAQYILGWDKLQDIWRRDLERPLWTTCTQPGFNPNTASREAILSYFPGLLEDEINTVLERRDEKPFRNIREFASAAGTIVRDEPFAYVFVPGTCAIIEVEHRPSGARTRFSLTIDIVNAKTKPWQIDYVVQIPDTEPAGDRKPASAEIFPAPDTLDAVKDAVAEDGDARAQGAVGGQPSINPPPRL
jgi:general secretion pathway protein K